MAFSMLGGETPKVNPGLAGADKGQTQQRCWVQQNISDLPLLEEQKASQAHIKVEQKTTLYYIHSTKTLLKYAVCSIAKKYCKSWCVLSVFPCFLRLSVLILGLTLNTVTSDKGNNSGTFVLSILCMLWPGCPSELSASFMPYYCMPSSSLLYHSLPCSTISLSACLSRPLCSSHFHSYNALFCFHAQWMGVEGRMEG